MLKMFSRTRSEVGRVSSPFGAWIVWPLRVPAMIRTRASVGRDGVSPPRPSHCLRAERLARLEQGLQAAEDVHPATSDVLGRLRCALELVVHDRQLRDAAFLRLDLPAHAARLLSCSLLVVERPPRVAEPSWRIRVQNLAVDPELLPVLRPTAVWRTGLEPRVNEAAVEVAARELRLRDRLPDLLRACLDEHRVDLDVRLDHRAHAVSSSSCLRSASADTRRSVYLSIHRSWIRRIGTGFR